MKNGEPWTPQEVEKAETLHDEGWSYNQIGRCLGRTRMAVYNALHKEKEGE